MWDCFQIGIIYQLLYQKNPTSCTNVNIVICLVSCVFTAWHFCLQIPLMRVWMCKTGSQAGCGNFKHTHNSTDDLQDIIDLSLHDFEPIHTPSYVNFPQTWPRLQTEHMKEHQRQRHVPQCMKKTSRRENIVLISQKKLCPVLSNRLNMLIFMVTLFLKERIHCDNAVGWKSQGSFRRDECFKITLKEALLKLSILHSSCQSQCHYAHFCTEWRITQPQRHFRNKLVTLL